MIRELIGETKTKQHIKNTLFSKHSDLFIQDFVEKSLTDDPNTINTNNVYYFSNNKIMFYELKNDVDKLLCETIDAILCAVGFEKNKDYFFVENNKIKTNPVIFVKVLSAYDYNAEMAKMLKNVLIY